MSRWTTPSAVRTAVGGVVAVAAVAAGIVGVYAPWPTIAHDPASVETTPAPADAVLACDGPVLALGRDAAEAGGLTAIGDPTLTARNDRGGEPDRATLMEPDVADSGGASVFVQEPDGRSAVSAAASSSISVEGSDMAGFAASACRAPAMESWLVGGDTATGVTGIVLLANPGEVDATVRLTVFGATDPVTPPGAEAMVVPAGTQLALPLAGIAGDEISPVVRVTATGAPVRASLQSSIVRTLEPGGLDSQASVTTASPTQVIPGVVVTAESGREGASTRVRLLAPDGDGEATVTVTARGETEPARDPETVQLEAGKPLGLEVPGLEPGAYTLTVDADVPVVAAAWQTTGFGEGSDFAWHAPAPELQTPTVVAVPPGPRPELYLTNPGEEDVEVSVGEVGAGAGAGAGAEAGEGEGEQVSVPAGGTASVPVSEDGTWWIDPGGATVHAAVSYASESAVASLSVLPAEGAQEPVVVYP